MDFVDFSNTTGLVPGSLLGSALETTKTNYGSPDGLDYHLLESPPLVSLDLAPDQLSASEELPPKTVAFQAQNQLINIDSVTGCPVLVDQSLDAGIDAAPMFLEYAVEPVAIACYSYSFNPPFLDALEAVAISDENFLVDTNLIDGDALSLTGEKADSLDSGAEIVPWNESIQEPVTVTCELESIADPQSILPTEGLIDPVDESIGQPQEFSELPAEILPSNESSTVRTLGSEDIPAVDLCLQQPIDSINAEDEPQISISPWVENPCWTDCEFDYSPRTIKFDSPDASVNFDSPDPLTEALDTSLLIKADVMSTDFPDVEGPQPTELPAVNPPFDEWISNEATKIPKVYICFLPDSDNSGLFPQSYDGVGIDVLSNEVNGDIGITLDPPDALPRFLGGTVTPLPWCRGYATASPENLSAQFLVSEQSIQTSDEVHSATVPILESQNDVIINIGQAHVSSGSNSVDQNVGGINIGQAQPLSGGNAVSEPVILPAPFAATALPESAIPVVAEIRNPDLVPEDSVLSEVLLPPHQSIGHEFAFEATASAAALSAGPRFIINERTSVDTDFQGKASNSADVINLLLNFNTAGSGGFASPLLWFGPNPLPKNLDLPSWLTL